MQALLHVLRACVLESIVLGNLANEITSVSFAKAQAAHQKFMQEMASVVYPVASLRNLAAE